MKITVQNLIRMIRHDEEIGILYTDQSTQRDFIYNSEYVMNEDGEITKAGNVIKSIIEYDITLPAIYFWSVQDDEKDIHYGKTEYNLHDGKQRGLSIYYFVMPDEYNKVTTIINGVSKNFKDLTIEQQEKLLNTEIDVVIRAGTTRQEEQSFIILNDNVTPLTNYEKLKGAYHGKFFDTFEQYINGKSLYLDSIKPVGRGHQAQYFIYMALGVIDLDRRVLYRSVQDILTVCRTSPFDYIGTKMDEKLELYNNLAKTGVILTNNVNKDPEKLCRIVNYIIDKGYDPSIVLEYYRNAKNDTRSDVGKWQYDIHKTAINSLFKGIKCDYKRFLTLDEKAILWSNEPTHICPICKQIMNGPFNSPELETDHENAWSKGGRTDLVNVRFVHKKCNAEKGSK